MQITVPAQLDNQPLFITIGGVKYTLSAGETIDLPNEVVEELNRMLAVKNPAAKPVVPPFTDGGMQQEIEDLREKVAAKEIPDFPTDDGAYFLVVEIDDGEATLIWEPFEDEES